MPNVFRFRRTSVPPEPNRNSEAVYAASDGTLKQVAPDGSETELGGGGSTPSLQDVLGAGNNAASFTIESLATPVNGTDAATKDYVDNQAGLPQGGPLTTTLITGDTSTSYALKGADRNGGTGSLLGTGQADVSGSGGNAELDGGQGAAGQPGGVASINGGGGDGGNTFGASIQALGGTATEHGRLFIGSNNEYGVAGQAIVSDGGSGVVWGGIQIAAAEPAGAPAGLPFAYDTRASVGGFYFWNGAAWVKIANIL